MTIALCVSGNLGYEVLQHLAKQKYEIACVFTDKRSQDIIEWAESKGAPLFIGNPRNSRGQAFTEGHSVDLLLSVNYLFLIDKYLIEWPKKYAVNIHGSLLPKYRGRTPHVWAIINNEQKTGITAHLIDEGCDTGPIVEQVEIPIEYKDTGGIILDKFKKHYPQLVDKLISSIEQQTLVVEKQDEEKATFFGKRTPSDGEINWNWQRERIHNWVRAQAYPYPGAFTWYNSEKVVIDEIAFDEYGFRYDIPNGTILSTEPLRVKTPNGAVRLTSVRLSRTDFKIDQQFKSYENS